MRLSKVQLQSMHAGRGVRHDLESCRQLQESLWNVRIMPESFESCVESLESHEISRRIIILIPSKTL